MRAVWLAAVLTLCHAQFEFFSKPNYEDSYNMVSDAVGVRDAIGAWGKVLRNLAYRNVRPQVQQNLREYTVQPSHMDINVLKTIPKSNGEIINEKLLNILLPRIRGQPAFSTTTVATTTTTASTTTSTASSTTEAPSTTNVTITTEAPTTVKEVQKTTTTQKPSTTSEATTTTEEILLPKGFKANAGPQFTAVFRTRDKALEGVKKAEIVDTDFNGDNVALSTTTEQKEDATIPPEPTTKKTTPKTTPKPKETKKTEQSKTKKNEIKTTVAPKMDKEEITIKNALKQKDLDDDEETSKKTTEVTTEMTTEGSGEEATEIALLTGAVELTTPKTTEATTKKPTTPAPKKEEKVKKEKSVNSAEVEAQIEKEATEILDLLNKPSKDKREELSRKLLLEKLREYLTQQEKTTKAPKVTTAAPKITKSASTKKSEKTTTVKPTTKKQKSTERPTSEVPSTTETTTTAEKPKETFSVKKSLLPEAEEEEQKPAFVQEDVPTTPKTTTATGTTLLRATSATPGITASGFNGLGGLNANGNTPSPAQLTNALTPIAGILDGISPILVPLLGSTGQVARSRARGSRTFEPTGGDIMSDSPGETSIVGFGTQLAREILSPGILKRERQARERAMTAKIEETKRMRESKSLIATILDAARTGPPLELPMINNPKPRSQEPVPLPQTSEYLPRPPPGYQGPLPPLPPPPPLGWVPRGYNGPIPDKFALPPATYGEATVQPGWKQYGSIENTPFNPLVITTPTPITNDEGFQMGRSGVKTTFREDSGVQFSGNGVVLGDKMPEMPEISIAPVDESNAFPPPGSGGSGNGFGGGRQPSVSFDEVEKKSTLGSSFLTSRKRL